MKLYKVAAISRNIRKRSKAEEVAIKIVEKIIKGVKELVIKFKKKKISITTALLDIDIFNNSSIIKFNIVNRSIKLSIYLINISII